MQTRDATNYVTPYRPISRDIEQGMEASKHYTEGDAVPSSGYEQRSLFKVHKHTEILNALREGQKVVDETDLRTMPAYKAAIEEGLSPSDAGIKSAKVKAKLMSDYDKSIMSAEFAIKDAERRGLKGKLASYFWAAENNRNMMRNWIVGLTQGIHEAEAIRSASNMYAIHEPDGNLDKFMTGLAGNSWTYLNIGAAALGPGVVLKGVSAVGKAVGLGGISAATQTTVGMATGKALSAAAMGIPIGYDTTLALTEQGVPLNDAALAGGIHGVIETAVEFTVGHMLAKGLTSVGAGALAGTGGKVERMKILAGLAGKSADDAGDLMTALYKARQSGAMNPLVESKALKAIFGDATRAKMVGNLIRETGFSGATGGIEEWIQEGVQAYIHEQALTNNGLEGVLPKMRDGSIDTGAVLKQMNEAFAMGVMLEGFFGGGAATANVVGNWKKAGQLADNVKLVGAYIANKHAQVIVDSENNIVGMTGNQMVPLGQPVPKGGAVINLEDLGPAGLDYIARSSLVEMIQNEKGRKTPMTPEEQRASNDTAIGNAIQRLVENPTLAGVIQFADAKVKMHGDNTVVFEINGQDVTVVKAEGPLAGNAAARHILNPQDRSVIQVSSETWDSLIGDNLTESTVSINLYKGSTLPHELFHALVETLPSEQQFELLDTIPAEIEVKDSQGNVVASDTVSDDQKHEILAQGSEQYMLNAQWNPLKTKLGDLWARFDVMARGSKASNRSKQRVAFRQVRKTLTGGKTSGGFALPVSQHDPEQEQNLLYAPGIEGPVEGQQRVLPAPPQQLPGPVEGGVPMTPINAPGPVQKALPSGQAQAVKANDTADTQRAQGIIFERPKTDIGSNKPYAIPVMKKEYPANETTTGVAESPVDMAERGEKTSTVFSEPLGKVGETITFEGRPQRYRVTGVHQITEDESNDPTFAQQISKSEGLIPGSIMGGRAYQYRPGEWITTYERVGKAKFVKNTHTAKEASVTKTGLPYKKKVDNGRAQLRRSHIVETISELEGQLQKVVDYQKELFVAPLANYSENMALLNENEAKMNDLAGKLKKARQDLASFKEQAPDNVGRAQHRFKPLENTPENELDAVHLQTIEREAREFRSFIYKELEAVLKEEGISVLIATDSDYIEYVDKVKNTEDANILAQHGAKLLRMIDDAADLTKTIHDRGGHTVSEIVSRDALIGNIEQAEREGYAVGANGVYTDDFGNPIKTGRAQPRAGTRPVNRGTGDIWERPGIVIVSTNLGGVHGRGLAKQAKDKGYITKENVDFDSSPAIQLSDEPNPVITIAVKGAAPETAKIRGKAFSEQTVGKNLDLLKSELRKLIRYARKNPKIQFNLPYIGLGFGEGNAAEIMPLLVYAAGEPNITLISRDGATVQKYAASFKPGVRRDATTRQESRPVSPKKTKSKHKTAPKVQPAVQSRMNALEADFKSKQANLWNFLNVYLESMPASGRAAEDARLKEGLYELMTVGTWFNAKNDHEKELAKMANEARRVLKDLIKDPAYDAKIRAQKAYERLDKIMDGSYKMPTVMPVPGAEAAWKKDFVSALGSILSNETTSQALKEATEAINSALLDNIKIGSVPLSLRNALGIDASMPIERHISLYDTVFAVVREESIDADLELLKVETAIKGTPYKPTEDRTTREGWVDDTLGSNLRTKVFERTKTVPFKSDKGAQPINLTGQALPADLQAEDSARRAERTRGPKDVSQVATVHNYNILFPTTYDSIRNLFEVFGIRESMLDTEDIEGAMPNPMMKSHYAQMTQLMGPMWYAVKEIGNRVEGDSAQAVALRKAAADITIVEQALYAHQDSTGYESSTKAQTLARSALYMLDSRQSTAGPTELPGLGITVKWGLPQAKTSEDRHMAPPPHLVMPWHIVDYIHQKYGLEKDGSIVSFQRGKSDSSDVDSFKVTAEDRGEKSAEILNSENDVINPEQRYGSTQEVSMERKDTAESATREVIDYLVEIFTEQSTKEDFDNRYGKPDFTKKGDVNKFGVARSASDTVGRALEYNTQGEQGWREFAMADIANEVRYAISGAVKRAKGLTTIPNADIYLDPQAAQGLKETAAELERQAAYGEALKSMRAHSTGTTLESQINDVQTLMERITIGLNNIEEGRKAPKYIEQLVKIDKDGEATLTMLNTRLKKLKDAQEGHGRAQERMLPGIEFHSEIGKLKDLLHGMRDMRMVRHGLDLYGKNGLSNEWNRIFGIAPVTKFRELLASMGRNVTGTIKQDESSDWHKTDTSRLWSLGSVFALDAWHVAETSEDAVSEAQALDNLEASIKGNIDALNEKINATESKKENINNRWELAQYELYLDAIGAARHINNRDGQYGKQVHDYLKTTYLPAAAKGWDVYNADILDPQGRGPIKYWSPRLFTDSKEFDPENMGLAEHYNQYTGRVRTRSEESLATHFTAGRVLSNPNLLNAYDVGMQQLINAVSNREFIDNGLTDNFLSLDKKKGYKPFKAEGAKKVTYDVVNARNTSKMDSFETWQDAADFIGKKQGLKIVPVNNTIYAPAVYADYFNRITAPSVIRQSDIGKALLSTNAKLKLFRIGWSMFHRRSLLWSAMMAGATPGSQAFVANDLKDYGAAWQKLKSRFDYDARRDQGRQIMEARRPEMFAHVFYGETLFRSQDFGEANLQYMTMLDKLITGKHDAATKTKLSKAVVNTARGTRMFQTELFVHFASPLKVASGINETLQQSREKAAKIAGEKLKSKETGQLSPQAEAYFQLYKDSPEQIKMANEAQEGLWKYNSETENNIIKRVSGLMNADFGGLHLNRMGISKSRFDLTRLLLLGPDWTASNFQTIAKLLPLNSKMGEGSDSFIGSDAQERAIYRGFWLRIAGRVAALTVALNLLMAGIDDEDIFERFKKAKGKKGFKALMVDISPMIHLMGGDDSVDHYMNMGGHFMDPLKWFNNPVQQAIYKGGSLTKPIAGAISGLNYKKQRPTHFSEIPSRGLYDWSMKKGPVTPTEYPSFITNEALNMLPFSVREAFGSVSGNEHIASQFLKGGMGMEVHRTYPKKGVKYAK